MTLVLVGLAVVSCQPDVAARAPSRAPQSSTTPAEASGRPVDTAVAFTPEFDQRLSTVNGGCWVLNDGRIQCWGPNSHGVLGNGSLEPRWGATFVQGISDARGVSRSVSHACAVRRNGEVMCWGDNTFRIFGSKLPKFSAVPVTIPGITGAIAVVVGAPCALGADGSVTCWSEDYEHLEAGSVKLPGPARQIAGGAGFTCALLGTAVYCWGYRFEFTQVETNDREHPEKVPGLPPVERIFGGTGSHVCALTKNGEAWCWGQRADGQLDGVSGPDGRVLPRRVPVGPLVNIATGMEQTCGQTPRGEVWCWGRRSHLEGGASVAPRRVEPLDGVTRLAAGYKDACGTRDGGVICWGELPEEMFFKDNTAYPYRLQPVSGLTDVVDVDVGFGHACAVVANGQVWCWGTTAGWVPGESKTDVSFVPRRIPDLHDAVGVVCVGTRHCVARRRDGRLSEWGGHSPSSFSNTNADAIRTSGLEAELQQEIFCKLELPTQPKCPARKPLDVPQLAGARFIDGSHMIVCGLMPDATVVCDGEAGWGVRGVGYHALAAYPVDGLAP